MDKFKEVLKPFFGNRCAISGAFTYEDALYFYAFDADAEKKIEAAVREALDLGDWKDLAREIDADPKNIVMFGVTVADDLNEQPAKEVAKAYKSRGLKGLASLGFASPGPLVYDRSNGRAFFFPDGSPTPLGKDRKTVRIDKLDLRVVGSGGKKPLSPATRVSMVNNPAIDCVDAGDHAGLVTLLERDLAGVTAADAVAAGKSPLDSDVPEVFAWLMLKKGEALEALGRPADAAVAYAEALAAGEQGAAKPLARLEKKKLPTSGGSRS